MPLLHKQFKYNLSSDFTAISKDNFYITYPNLDEIFSCQLPVGYYCEINTPFHPLDSTNHCSYYLLQNNLSKIEQLLCMAVLALFYIGLSRGIMSHDAHLWVPCYSNT